MFMPKFYAYGHADFLKENCSSILHQSPVDHVIKCMNEACIQTHVTLSLWIVWLISLSSQPPWSFNLIPERHKSFPAWMRQLCRTTMTQSWSGLKISKPSWSSQSISASSLPNLCLSTYVVLKDSLANKNLQRDFQITHVVDICEKPDAPAWFFL